MNRPGPAPERGGVPAALANVRKGGLKKARDTSVIADMMRTELPEQSVEAPHAPLHAVPALQAEAEMPAPVEVQLPPAAEKPAQAAVPPTLEAKPVQDVPLVQDIQPPAQVPAQPASAPPPAEKKAYRKTSFFQSQESGSRMRSAYMVTRHLTGSRTLSDFILAAVEREVEALEKRYNDGNVFDADPGSVPRGRPLEL